MLPPIPEDKMALIQEALFHGRKIEAIKLYREETNIGLAEAKNAIDKLEAELRATSPFRFTAPASGKGCIGVIAMGVAVAVAVTIVSWFVMK